MNQVRNAGKRTSQDVQSACSRLRTAHNQSVPHVVDGVEGSRTAHERDGDGLEEALADGVG
jgi:hypothetical protein